jgi:hypothetical protein
VPGQVELRIDVLRNGSGYAARFIGKAPDSPITWEKGLFLADTPTAAAERVLSHIQHIADHGRRAHAYRVARHLARGTAPSEKSDE